MYNKSEEKIKEDIDIIEIVTGIKKIECVLVGILAIVFLWLRLYQIEKRMNFSMDQGLFMLKALDIWRNKKLELIGPSASPIVNGRHFFQGPITYYWLIFCGLLASWDPENITIIITLMSLASMGFLYMTTKKLFGKGVGVFSVIIWTLLPTAIDFSGLIWNPSLLLILVPPTLYVGVLTIKEKKWWQFGILGMLLGWCLQCHFQAGLLIILTGLVMVFKRIKLSKWIYLLMGFLIGYFPLVVFDFRNNFYNTKTIFEWIGQRGNGLEMQQFYLLEFLPILVILIAKIFYRSRLFLIGGLIIFLCWSVTNQKQAKGMPMFWNYRDLRKTSEIVMKKAESEYNVVNLLSGDTRFYSLRYLMTAEGKLPMPIDKYDKELWVVSYKDNNLKNSTVWELEKTENMEERARFEINPKVDLIQLR